MTNENKDGILGSAERMLDTFFAAPGKMFYGFANKFFEYTYTETDKGVFGLFDSPEKIAHAAERTLQKGYTGFDCLTPFPVHGLEFKMGLKRSKIPYVTFVAGLTGTLTAFLMQYIIHEQVLTIPYMNSYPLNIGGKPTFSWPAMIPVCFELTILFAGLATVGTLLLLSRMPKKSRPILHPDITQDKFCLWIPASSNQYNEDEVKGFLSELGASDITVVSK